MTSRIPLSLAAQRAGDAPISDLMAKALASPDLISLAAGFVDHATLPVAATARAAREVLSDQVEAHRALQYGTTRGDLALRRELARLIERQEGATPGALDWTLDRMIVTSGSQQLLYLVAEALIDPGDIVLVESPTYFVFLGVLRARGARVIGVEVDDAGLRIDALESRLAEIESRGELDKVKLIYTVSEHSNPTGLSLDLDRREALVAVARAWSKNQRIYILEDAAYRGLTYEGPEAPSVWSFDQERDTVILARTFSKTFSPGLKIGYGILPPPLVSPLLALKGNHDFGSTHFAQRLLERVLASGDYESQIRLLRDTYDAKRQAMLGALAEHFGPWGDRVGWTHPRGGLFVWLSLPEEIDTGREGGYFERCLAEGVLYVPGAYACPNEPAPAPKNCARLSFGVTSSEGLVEGVRRMARALDGLCAPARRASARVARSTVAAV